MSNDLQSELTADLLRDLSAPAVQPVPPVPTRGEDAPAGAVARASRPAVSVVFTPLHWMRPSVGRLGAGAGVSVAGGPWRVDVAV